MDWRQQLTEALLALGILIAQITILFFSIVVHEVSHGYTAYRLGDPTAKRMGRLTLNPAPHIDTFGSMLFLFTLLLTLMKLFPIPIGYAKPVMIDFRFFKDPLKGMALVAISGPAANLLLASCFFGIHYLILILYPEVPAEYRFIFVFGIFINTLLALFNLIPIPPLDGSNILAGFLPWRYTIYFNRFQRYGIALILVLIFVIFSDEERLLTLVKSFYGMFGINL